MRGRPRKPTAVKAAEGNPGKRPLNRRELSEPAEIPPCPRFLDKTARRLWSRLTRILFDRGLIREEDMMLLAALCAAWSTLQLAYAQLAAIPEKRRLVKSNVRNGLLFVIRDQVGIIERIAAQFGFSPAARARLAFADPGMPAAADIDDLLRGPAERDEDDPPEVVM